MPLKGGIPLKHIFMSRIFMVGIFKNRIFTNEQKLAFLTANCRIKLTEIELTSFP